MHSLKSLTPYIIFFLCLLITACKEPIQAKEEQKYLPHSREEVMLSYASVVKKVAPAVVNIYAFQHQQIEVLASPFMNDPFFKQFFERLHPSRKREQSSLGSGVIIDKKGLILTSYHVIENADKVQVSLADKRQYNAKLVVVDKRTDLALLKIDDYKDFPSLQVSPQEDLEVGDVVLAIGNPFGVGQTVTNGIVSALARSQEGISDFRTFIQTDAAINPGNSGGALVTTDGRLVGINTAIYSKSGGSVGIGFAIPTTLAIPVIESVKTGGRIVRPWIGLESIPVTAEAIQILGLDRPYGVLVKSIYPQGPADKAGLQVGDFIAAINGREIEDDAALDYQIAILPIGTEIEVSLLRNGEKKKISMTLLEPRNTKDSKPLTIHGNNPLQGIRISTLSPALAFNMGLNPMKEGVVIVETSKAKLLEQMEIRPGDILESINDQDVKTKEEVLRLLQKANSSSWIFVFRRGDKILKIQIKQRGSR